MLKYTVDGLSVGDGEVEGLGATTLHGVLVLHERHGGLAFT